MRSRLKSTGSVALDDRQHGKMFVHEPLDLSQRTIRVLQILPDSENSMVKLIVKHVPLEDKHVCLSYTWGEDGNKKLIELNDEDFEVRQNLHDFLVRARKDDLRHEMLWIGKTCLLV
jgi:hypothetical protein